MVVPSGSGGLSGLLGSLGAAVADAELLASLGPALAGASSPAAAALERLMATQGWLGGAWWFVERGVARPTAALGLLERAPWPRAGVGPLGRSLVLGGDEVVRLEAEPDCPRSRLAARAGCTRAAVLVGHSGGAEGRLELVGRPEGHLGPERVALLRHVAWLLAEYRPKQDLTNPVKLAAPQARRSPGPRFPRDVRGGTRPNPPASRCEL